MNFGKSSTVCRVKTVQDVLFGVLKNPLYKFHIVLAVNISPVPLHVAVPCPGSRFGPSFTVTRIENPLTDICGDFPIFGSFELGSDLLFYLLVTCYLESRIQFAM